MPDFCRGADGPSKTAPDSETIIWAQDLADTGVTVNALLPGGATLTGVIPESVDETVKRSLLDPAIMGPPLLWLVSQDADRVTGLRFDSAVWALREAGHDEADTARGLRRSALTHQARRVATQTTWRMPRFP